jgi:predicted nucleotidyltransferase
MHRLTNSLMVFSTQDIEGFITKKESILRSVYSIQSMTLFGSFAEEQQSKDSDIDILYTTQNNYRLNFREYMRLLAYLEEGLGRKVDLIRFEDLNPVISSDKTLSLKSLL